MSKKIYKVSTAAVAASERRSNRVGGYAGGSASGSIYNDYNLSGKADRADLVALAGLFDSMFELVTPDEGAPYIRAKYSFASVGEIVNHASDGLLVGSPLLGAVDILSPEDGQMLVYRNGRWVNESVASGGGGIDEAQLASYLSRYGYVTSSVLGNYVTLNTQQTITAVKVFAEEVRFIGNGTYSDPAVGVRCGLKSQLPIATGGFIKAGGTSAQFLKADGTVDSSYYMKCAHGYVTLQWLWGSNLTHVVGFEGGNSSAMRVYSGEVVRNFANAVNKAGDTITGVLDVKTDVGGAINIHTLTTATNPFMRFWRAGTAKGNIGFDDTNGFGLFNYACSKHLSIKDDGTPHFEGDKLWHAGNDGAGSGLDADLLDGLHSNQFMRESVVGKVAMNANDLFAAWTIYRPDHDLNTNTAAWTNFPVSKPPGGFSLINLQSGNYKHQLYLDYNHNNIFIRRQYYNNGVLWSGWTRLVNEQDNIASATKLQTARTIYINSYNNYKAGDGVSFDGSNNIILKLPNTICTSEWFRSIGVSGWYNETYLGGIYMDSVNWVKLFNKPLYIGTLRNMGANHFNVALNCPLMHNYHTTQDNYP